MSHSALALVVPFRSPGDASRLEPLRRRLAGARAGDTEAVLVDFIDDDLQLARAAIEELQSWVGRVEARLNEARPFPGALRALSVNDEAADAAETLVAAVDGVRRRLGRLAGRL